MTITSSSELELRLELRARIDVSRGKLEIQEISVSQCQSVAFEVTFCKASRSTKLNNKGVKVAVRCIIYMRVSGKRIVVSRVEVQIQVISVPQCHSAAFEVIQSLVDFRKASSSTKLVENPGNSSLAPDKAKSERLLEIRTLNDEVSLTRYYTELAGNRWREKNVKSVACRAPLILGGLVRK